MKYDEEMDRECVKLCNAMNSIPGIETFCSCCGHGKGCMWIDFHAKSMGSIIPIINYVSHDYHCGTSSRGAIWTCECLGGEFWNSRHRGYFRFYSRSVGRKAYAEANKIARKINDRNNT